MSNPKHSNPLVPREAAAIDINYLLDHYAERIAARSGPRPGVSLINELPALGSPLRGSGSFDSKSTLGRPASPSPVRPASPSPGRASSPISSTKIATTVNILKIVDGESAKHIPIEGHAARDPKVDQFREEIASFLLKAPYTISVFGAGFQVASFLSLRIGVGLK
jgi:hypothetical protein